MHMYARSMPSILDNISDDADAVCTFLALAHWARSAWLASIMHASILRRALCEVGNVAMRHVKLDRQCMARQQSSQMIA
jgi:hypothetical protein